MAKFPLPVPTSSIAASGGRLSSCNARSPSPETASNFGPRILPIALVSIFLLNFGNIHCASKAHFISLPFLIRNNLLGVLALQAQGLSILLIHLLYRHPSI